jgi:leader peptidase (prepilin peptidase)/N-methyltransferase
MIDLTTIPFLWLVLLAAGFGLIIGSFLNVVIFRFHTGKSLAGSSHCMSCGQGLRWFDLVPVLSYIVLFGRCRACGSYISPRYPIVETVTALAFVSAVWITTDIWLILLLWVLSALLVVVSAYDLDHFIIPDQLTAAILGVVLVLSTYERWQLASVESIIIDVALALGGSMFLYLLWFVSKGKWLGFGDVKLALPLGLWVGGSAVFTFIVVSFWVGAAISLLLLVWQWYRNRGQSSFRNLKKRLTMKSAVPFAPFLILAAWITYTCDFSVLAIFS